MAKLNIMEPLDKAIFQKLEEVQSNKEVQKVMDAYANLDEKPQEIVKALMAASLIVLPLLLISVFYGMNASLKSELDTKSDLLKTAQTIIKDQAGIKNAQRQILGNSFVGSMNDMQNLVARAISMAGIDSTKVNVSNFESIEQDGFITQATIDMKFNGLSNAEIFGLISSLSDRQKVKFEEISVKKNSSNNMLEGVATLSYISKDNTSEDQR